MSNWLYSTIHELGIIPSSNRREFQRAVQNGKLNRQKGDKSGNKMAFFFPPEEKWTSSTCATNFINSVAVAFS